MGKKIVYRKKNTEKKYIKRTTTNETEEYDEFIIEDEPQLETTEIKIESDDEIVISPEIDTDSEEEKDIKVKPEVRLEPELKPTKKMTLSKHIEGYLTHCISNYLIKLIKQPINYEKQREKILSNCQFQHKKYQVKISIINPIVINNVYDKIVTKLSEEKNKMVFLQKMSVSTKEKYLICVHLINDKINEMQNLNINEITTEEYKMEIEQFI